MIVSTCQSRHSSSTADLVYWSRPGDPYHDVSSFWPRHHLVADSFSFVRLLRVTSNPKDNLWRYEMTVGTVGYNAGCEVSQQLLISESSPDKPFGAYRSRAYSLRQFSGTIQSLACNSRRPSALELAQVPSFTFSSTMDLDNRQRLKPGS